MDTDSFDRLTRALSADSSRRGLLAGLASSLFAALAWGLGGDGAEAKKRKRKRKKKRKGNQTPPSPCVPDCTGKLCGADGCGKSCGSCVGSEICQDGTCRCPDDRPACGVAGNCCGADRLCLGVGTTCACIDVDCGDICCDRETQRCDSTTCVACAATGDGCATAEDCCQPQPNSRSCAEIPFVSSDKICCGASGATCTIGQRGACCSGICHNNGFGGFRCP